MTLISTASKVRERPIIFGAEMVRAILDGRKTQTRRVMKPQPFPLSREAAYVGIPADGDDFAFPYAVGASVRVSNKRNGPKNWANDCPCRHGVVGDHLWVREAWQAWTEFDHLPVRLIPNEAMERINFLANGVKWDAKVRSPLYLPRWASRITLEITDVRVQRAQDISEWDARAEGLTRAADGPNICAAYRHLWDRINGKSHPWSSNPWVWAISFRVLSPASTAPAAQEGR